MTEGIHGVCSYVYPGEMGSRQGGDFFLGEQSERRTAPGRRCRKRHPASIRRRSLHPSFLTEP